MTAFQVEPLRCHSAVPHCCIDAKCLRWLAGFVHLCMYPIPKCSPATKFIFHLVDKL